MPQPIIFLHVHSESRAHGASRAAGTRAAAGAGGAEAPAAAEAHRRHDRDDARVSRRRPGRRRRCTRTSGSSSRCSRRTPVPKSEATVIINPRDRAGRRHDRPRGGRAVSASPTSAAWCRAGPTSPCARSTARARRSSCRSKGFAARVAQHETDHLDGVLFFDRMTSMQSLTYLDEYSRYHAKGRGLVLRAPRRPSVTLRTAPDGAVRRRDRRRPHLLFAAGHRHRRGHRLAARHHRRADLRRRAPHRLPARALRVRAREHLAAVRVGVPALLPVLQLGAVQPALREAEGAAGVRAADHRRRARHLRERPCCAPGTATPSCRRCSRTTRSAS